MSLIGENLKAIRTEKRFTVAELARRTKISRVSITAIENQDAVPSSKTLKAICDVLEIPVTALIGQAPSNSSLGQISQPEAKSDELDALKKEVKELRTELGKMQGKFELMFEMLQAKK